MKPEPNAAHPPQKLIIRSAVPCSSTRSSSGDRARHQRAAGDQTDVPSQPEQEQPDEDQWTVIAGQHRAGRTAGEHDARDHHGAIRTDALHEPTNQWRKPVHARDVHRDDVARRTGLMVVAHVRRRHRHHRNHSRLNGDHRRQSELHHRLTSDHAPTIA